MVLLPVDEAYALDYYAILMVKADNGLPVDSELERAGNFLKVQIANFDKVLCAAEFQRLYIANQLTFDAVAQCRTSPAQKANRKRFLAKRHLQAKFWPAQPLTEVKKKGD